MSMLYAGGSPFSTRSPSPATLRASSATPDPMARLVSHEPIVVHSVQDRTAEFFGTVESIVDRMEQNGQLGPVDRRRLLGGATSPNRRRAASPVGNGLPSGTGKTGLAGQVAMRTQFARDAVQIGKVCLLGRFTSQKCCF